MTRGHPDYLKNVGISSEGNFLVGTSIAPIYFEDRCDTPEPLWKIGDGQGAMLFNYWDDSPPPFGNTVMRLKSNIAGGDDDFSAYKLIGAVPGSRYISFEIVATFLPSDFYANRNDAIIPLYFRYFCSTYLMVASISYNPYDESFYVYTGTPPNYVKIITHGLEKGVWHHLKMIVDFNNKKYISLIVNRTIYDISTYSLYSEADDDEERNQISIIAYSNGVDDCEVNVCRYRVSYNES